MEKNNLLISRRTSLLKVMQEVVNKYKTNNDFFCLKENKENKETIINELYILIKTIKQNKSGHYLSVNRKGIFSYAYSPDLKYCINKRREVSLRKYITNNILYNKDIINDHILNNFIKDVLAKYLSNKIVVKKVKGKLIKQYYESFDLDSRFSCMTHRSYLTHLYVMNPSKVSLLMMDEIRALLWKTDEGVTVLDRVYPAGHHKMNILKEWAIRNGYGVRFPLDQVVKNSVIKVFYAFNNPKKQYHVTLNHPDVGSFPYLDTFCFGKFIKINKSKKIVLSNCLDNMDFYFQNTNGFSVRIPEERTCSFCKENDRFGFYYDSGYYCNSCRKKIFVRCFECDRLVLAKDIVDEDFCKFCSED